MFTLGSKPVTALTLTMPAIGRSVAHVSLADTDATAAATGLVSLTDGNGFTLLGNTVSENVESRLTCWAGGPSALRSAVGARSYRDREVKDIAADIVGAAYSSRSTPTTAKTKLPFWTRIAGTQMEALRDLADALGVRWRTLDDGSIWVGTDSYPELKDFDATILDTDAITRTKVVALDSPRLRPGQTWRGIKIDAVEYSFSQKQSLRATIWYV